MKDKRKIKRKLSVSLAGIISMTKTEFVTIAYIWRKEDQIISERDCIIFFSSISIGVSHYLENVSEPLYSLGM